MWLVSENIRTGRHREIYSTQSFAMQQRKLWPVLSTRYVLQHSMHFLQVT